MHTLTIEHVAARFALAFRKKEMWSKTKVNAQIGKLKVEKFC